MAWFKRKKKKSDEDDDLSIVQDYKEPFSWPNFWEKNVTNRYKAIKEFLKDKGVLYFILSPFQYKNRLVFKVVLIVVGIMIGIVPRTMGMVSQLRAEFHASELASTKSTTNGAIEVDPLMSSHDKNGHVMAFNIVGDTSDGVPSTTKGFNVTMEPLNGVTNPSGVQYQYKILPVSNNNRLLLMYVHNKTEKGTNGMFNLDVHIAGQSKMKTPMKIVLGSSQETTALYKNGKINLSALSTSLTKENMTSSTTIKQAQSALNQQLKIYHLNEQRLEGLNMQLNLTTDVLKQDIQKMIIMPSLTDTSTTKDLAGLNPNQNSTKTLPTPSITYEGHRYVASSNGNTSNDNSANTNSTSTTNQARDTELPNVATLLTNVQQAISTLNSSRMDKYNALSSIQQILNQQLTPNEMSTPQTVQKK